MEKKSALNSYLSRTVELELEIANAGPIAWASDGTLDQGLTLNLFSESKEKTKAVNNKADWQSIAVPEHYEDIYLEMLIGAIQALSSDCDTQISLLPPGSDEPDKLMAAFEDCYTLMESIRSAGILEEDTFLKIKQLYLMLVTLNLKPDQWNVASMKTSPEWEAIRVLAREVLEITGGKISKPESNWLKYE